MLIVKIVDNKIVDMLCVSEVKNEHKVYTVVPDTFEGSVNDDIRMFDKNGKRLPVSKLVKLGYKKLNEREKIIGEQIVQKTFIELVQDGVEKMPFGKKIVDGQLVDMTPAEMAREGLHELPKSFMLDGDKIVQKPYEQLVSEGLVVLQPTQKVVNNEIVLKSFNELVEEELVNPASDIMHFVKGSDGNYREEELSKDEILSAKLRTEKELYDLYSKRILDDRQFALTDSDWTDTVSAKERLGDELYNKWQEYRQALRDITKQKTYPWSVTWPTDPNGATV